jgi:hypothetical protein
VIGPIVVAAVDAVGPSTPREATQLSGRTALLLSWCCERGMDMVREVVFHPETIDQFIVEGCAHLSAGSRATYRSSLLRVGEAFVGAPFYAPRPVRLPSSGPEHPYTAAEITALVAWARALPTASMRDGTAALLALGLGTGIRSAEVNHASADWVEETAAGLAVVVKVGRSRRVPVKKRWEQALREALLRADGGLLFRPERTRIHEKHVARFVERLPCGDAPKLSTQRLRVSWIVDHLDERVPVSVLEEVAGIGADTLGRYARFMQPIDVAITDELLRGDW